MNYRNARDLHDEIEALVGHEIDGVTVNHNTGEVDVEGVTDQELEEIRRNVNPQADAAGRFRRGRGGAPDAGNAGGQGGGGGGGG